MLHLENEKIREKLLFGQMGLEKENLRIDANGYIAKTKHPFPGNKHIVRDFSESQLEINTSVWPSAKEALDELAKYNQYMKEELKKRDEYIWPFSNPPYIRNGKDIPVAIFEGELASKTKYREHLSNRYGRYKMAFSGIHVNYSFAEELLKEEYTYYPEMDYTEFKNQFYLDLAKQLTIYGWILTCISAASPILDSSYVEKGICGQDHFNGMASVRCSELGYWNFFTPIFDFTNIRSYANSMQRYVDQDLLDAPTELYYPIRLKPKGDNILQVLHDCGVDHLELRMFDLNPLAENGLDLRDVQFAQLFLVWMASLPSCEITEKDQVQAVQNYKSAAHYDLKTVVVQLPDGTSGTAITVGKKVLEHMMEFYQGRGEEIQSILRFEWNKFEDENNRYAYKIRKMYTPNFVEKGIELAKKQ